MVITFGRPIAQASVTEILEESGLFVRAIYYPPGKAARYTAEGWADKTVIVRGKPGRMIYADTSGTQKIRLLIWEEPQADGGTLQWQFTTKKDAYADERVIEIANAMSELP